MNSKTITSMRPPTVIKQFLFTALPCEAKPLLAHFNLKKDQSSHPFALYYNDDTVLTVSGMGKNAMAASVSYSLAKFQAAHYPVLVNVGIAGHKTSAIGELFAAHKITDVETNRHFYPQIVTKLPCSSKEIQTVSVPETAYTDDCLYDMEASAFFEIAARFSTAELIQVFKVVSDNQHADIRQIDAVSVNAWITAKLDSIAEGIKQLTLLAEPLEIKESPYYAIALQRWHFTVNAQLQLKALLQRWHVLTNDSGDKLDFLAADLKNSKAVMQWLSSKIDKLNYQA